MYEDVLALLHKTNVSYEKFEHEPVLDYETDRIVRERLGLQGTPSKSFIFKIKVWRLLRIFYVRGHKTQPGRNERTNRRTVISLFS